MSGQLVGEVGAARESGALAKLTQGQTLILVAIAERCRTDTRRGQVRLGYLMAWTGQSRSSVQRALRTLHDLDIVTTARRGFKPNGGGPQAPIYELAELASPWTTQAQGESACVTMDDASSPSLRQTGAELASNRGRACVTQGDPHDVSTYDVPTYDDIGYFRSADETSTDHDDENRSEGEPLSNASEIADDWWPSGHDFQAMIRETARSRAFIEHETDKFVDDYRSTTAARRVQVDWRETWRRWILKADRLDGDAWGAL